MTVESAAFSTLSIAKVEPGLNKGVDRVVGVAAKATFGKGHSELPGRRSSRDRTIGQG
jgi:hypothetical protein